MLELFRKLIALQFVLLACITSAKLCKEEKENEVIQDKLLELEHECESKTAEAQSCINDLDSTFGSIHSNWREVSKIICFLPVSYPTRS